MDLPRLLPKPRVDALLALLVADGWEVVGPRVDGATIVTGPLRRAAELPIGWRLEEGPGTSRLVRRDDAAWFGHVPGPHAWRRWLLAPVQRLFGTRVVDGAVVLDAPPPDPPRRAFVGVRPCDLAGIAVQDRVYLHGTAGIDPWYAAARERVLLVAVECAHPGGSCFCASMGTGPGVGPAGAAADLVLGELPEAFVVHAPTARGVNLVARLDLPLATADDVHAVRTSVAEAAGRMGRRVDTAGLPALLARNAEHPRWDDAATRCTGCTSCTQVCPTCFCSAVHDEVDVAGDGTARIRRQDSCFAAAFARVHGGSFRTSLRARYRQWLTHKFGSWWAQFGTSGCVGCGRCVTWCPAGIDVTEELAAIRATDGARPEVPR